MPLLNLQRIIRSSSVVLPETHVAFLENHRGCGPDARSGPQKVSDELPKSEAIFALIERAPSSFPPYNGGPVPEEVLLVAVV